MASLGHVAVGMAVGRLHAGRPRAWGAMALFGLLALLPDADWLGMKAGIPYADAFGHRGASHSLAFALLCALLARVGGSTQRTALLVLLAVASHPLLDAMTTGGLGVAALWPLDGRRWFLPWRPIPVAPLGAGMWSARGLYVLGFEAAAFSPLWLWALALWRRRG